MYTAALLPASGESGGIGRRTGFRIQRATVRVQLPPLAPDSNPADRVPAGKGAAGLCPPPAPGCGVSGGLVPQEYTSLHQPCLPCQRTNVRRACFLSVRDRALLSSLRLLCLSMAEVQRLFPVVDGGCLHGRGAASVFANADAQKPCPCPSAWVWWGDFQSRSSG